MAICRIEVTFASGRKAKLLWYYLALVHIFFGNLESGRWRCYRWIKNTPLLKEVLGFQPHLGIVISSEHYVSLCNFCLGLHIYIYIFYIHTYYTPDVSFSQRLCRKSTWYLNAFDDFDSFELKLRNDPIYLWTFRYEKCQTCSLATWVNMTRFHQRQRLLSGPCQAGVSSGAISAAMLLQMEEKLGLVFAMLRFWRCLLLLFRM